MGIEVVGSTDSRSVMTNAAAPRFLEEVAAQLAFGQSEVPRPVDLLWSRALGQVRTGYGAYENFTEAVRIALETVDCSLRLGRAAELALKPKTTFGALIRAAADASLLTADETLWLHEFALHFRNRLTHSDGADPVVITPPMAIDFLRSIRGRVLDFGATGAAVPRDPSDRASMSERDED